MGLLNTNKFKLVGTIVEVKNTERMNKFTAHNEIVSRVVVKSVIDGKENIFNVTFKAGEMTAKNVPNKLYSTYKQIEQNFLNHKVEITGQLSEGFMFGREDTEISFTSLTGKFISASNKADEANFTLGGFVLSTIGEKRSKKTDELLGYNFRIAQANYSESNMLCFSIDIPSDDNALIEGVKTYNAGDTVTIQGNMRSYQQIVTYETMKKTAFGASQTEQRINHQRYFYISCGDAPLPANDPAHYSKEAIQRLISAYKEKGAERQQRHNASAEARESAGVETPVTSTEAAATAPARPSIRQSSLL